ncbi:unnamed protein product [Caenorhabditis auriculariae]|uniref:2Fe-2S ferredoxin-type domain-containing protein n=1 Tax=Caenorhabditis auriculariae TaxID=2777116 RepID=A0A8S1GSW4_9PELO|nr:unnamed protein product [Caenorhabditis auriculariae]
MFALRNFACRILNALPQTRLLSSASETRTVRFLNGDRKFDANGKIGQTLLDVVVEHDLALDGFGACEGTLACCTCHVILGKEHFEREDKLNPAGEEELDLLDMAPELNDYSRLGCQIKITKKDPEVVEVVVPTINRDARNS